MDIKEFLKGQKITGSRRFDCPECGGRNTLSVTNYLGDLVWQCFKSSCNVKGNYGYPKSPDLIKAILTGKDEHMEKFELPEHFTSIHSSKEAREYLRRNNCWGAYVSGLAEVQYDPKQNRVVFLVYETGNVVDAVGRALDRHVKPKWYRYGSSKYPFICGLLPNALIVEDCASACAVSNILTGIALLGTSLQDTHLAPLKRYKKVTVALDRDATNKAIEIQRVLKFHLNNVSMLMLDEDLKYFAPHEIKDILKNVCGETI